MCAGLQNVYTAHSRIRSLLVYVFVAMVVLGLGLEIRAVCAKFVPERLLRERSTAMQGSHRRMGGLCANKRNT